jgi:hypothetical protein
MLVKKQIWNAISKTDNIVLFAPITMTSFDSYSLLWILILSGICDSMNFQFPYTDLMMAVIIKYVALVA